MNIKREILSLRRTSVCAESLSSRVSRSTDRKDVEIIQRELTHLRQICSGLTTEKAAIRLLLCYIRL